MPTFLDGVATGLGIWLAEIAAHAAHAAHAAPVGGVPAILLVGVLVWLLFGFAVEHDE